LGRGEQGEQSGEKVLGLHYCEILIG
jgi:hypothetical protein